MQALTFYFPKNCLLLSKYSADHEATGLLGDLIVYGTRAYHHQNSTIITVFDVARAQIVNIGLHAGLIHISIIPE